MLRCPYMDTKTMSWVLGIAVVLGGVWYLSSRPATVTTVAPTATTTPTTAQPTAKKPSPPVAPKPTTTTAQTVGVGPLTYLLGLKQTLVCSIKTVGGTVRSGTLYVAGGMARANLAGSTMIDDGTYLYAWMTGATTGAKLLAASSVSGSAIGGRGGVDPTADISYACNPWTADASLFVPPVSVSF